MPELAPTFNPLHYPLALANPTWITDAHGWIAHAPFAMTLIQMLRPRTFVELGTYKGDSYCAFCQAVAIVGADTRCFAIDSWRGDDHTGHYDGERLLQSLRAYHDPHYGKFSTLIQSDFDAAVAGFADGSIDLLHIDGCHTYDAVRHDYQTWKPKLSERAVVLFHDTQMRELDFGVWRFWAEISRDRPHFEFHHANGLGVLGAGNRLPAEFLGFIAVASAAPDAIRHYFFCLGQRIQFFKAANVMSRALARVHELADQWHRNRAAPPLPSPPPATVLPDAFASQVLDEIAAILNRAA